ncbi:GHKL domain-containing protein [Streptococcus sp. CSL10205-OR2]|uniref:GHKL domain-containing protein n=1 Tax=Streptococcus sp. CSL10205-OR2 TaxID=2980558 RepID=UPI0021D94839|nr:GHKL domain-containing protein [Streptococcus sp. CSL10205-OR2]MCU9534103.1 GHKL domain-containing protein [Streptococcus sp. CSL10205-OR2]
MTLEFEGIFFISWIFRLLILSYITNQRLNPYFLSLPFIFLGIYALNYDLVFWGEIFFLPIALFFVRRKYQWNWIKYFFYSLFPFVFFEIFGNFSNLYNRFLFKLTADQWYNFYWSEWIDNILAVALCFGFLKLFRIEFKEINNRLDYQKDLQKLFKVFNGSLIVYALSTYTIANLIFLMEGNQFYTSIDLVYIRRHLLNFYFIFIIGIVFQINYLAKKNRERELAERKDSQIKDLTSYSQHIEALYKEIRSFRHDYTNILVSFNEAIKSKDIESIETIYKSVLAESDKKFYQSKYDIAHLSNLNNTAMKSLVSAKLIEAQTQEINIFVEVPDPIDVSKMELVDFLTILSVFLDNAIEASQMSDEVILRFAYFEEANQKILVIENSTSENKVNTKEIFQYGISTKGSDRGIGLSNVKNILSKYPDISLNTTSSNHTFTQELIMN